MSDYDLLIRSLRCLIDSNQSIINSLSSHNELLDTIVEALESVCEVEE